MLFLPARIFKHIIALPSGVLFIYLGAYLMLRFLFVGTHTDGRQYLIFPEEKPALYYAFRPLSYADEHFTGWVATWALTNNWGDILLRDGPTDQITPAAEDNSQRRSGL